MDIPRNWTFKDSSVASGFDRHVREQLPWYDMVTGAVAHIARHYIPERGRVYDIGASTGNVGRALGATIEARDVDFIPIDSSPEMGTRYDGPGEIVVADATEYAYQSFDVAICFLAVMFMPVVRRRHLVEVLVGNMRPGGCVIIVDKTDPPGGKYLGTAMRRLAIAGKVAANVDPAEIVAKELSLSGVQRPVSKDVIYGVSSESQVTEFFRFGEFAGWVIEADDR